MAVYFSLLLRTLISPYTHKDMVLRYDYKAIRND